MSARNVRDSRPWRIAKLGDVCEKITDGTHHSPANGRTGDFKYVTAKNIRPTGLDLTDVTYVDAATHREIYARCDVRKDDILYVKDGATTGRVALNTLEEQFSLLSSVGVLRPNRQHVLPKYLLYALQAPMVKDRMLADVAGVAITRLTLKKLKAAEIPLASLDQQGGIVAELEKQFSRLDEAVANLKRVKANFKRYRSAVLKVAVEGRLVPTEATLRRREGRACEPAISLLVRMPPERVGEAGTMRRRRAPLEPDRALEFAVPEGWAVASLDQLSTKITSGSRDWSPYYNRGQSIFVLAQNVRPLAPDFSATQRVDPPAADPSRERSRLNAGDLITTIVGANTGQVCLVEVPPGDAYVCQSVALIRPVSSGLGQYLNYWLNSEEHGQRYFERCMYGQGRPHLSFDQLKATPIVVPPPAEQERIVAEVDRRLSIAREVEAEVDANLKRAQALRQAVLQRAFAFEHASEIMALA